jgi:hypothetical protein
MPYIVIWDNGHASGTLAGSYADELAANSAGNEWWSEMVALDPNPTEAAGVYSYEVVEVDSVEYEGGV